MCRGSLWVLLLLAACAERPPGTTPPAEPPAPECTDGEERSMHIDGKKVFLGIPQPDALAVVKLPPGKEYPITESLETLATLETYDANTFEQLREEIQQITK